MREIVVIIDGIVILGRGSGINKTNTAKTIAKPETMTHRSGTVKRCLC